MASTPRVPVWSRHVGDPISSISGDNSISWLSSSVRLAAMPFFLRVRQLTRVGADETGSRSG